jgi:hypothetical protein
MWLSDKAARAGMDADPTAEICSISIGGEDAAAIAAGEMRELETVAPGGYVWLPETGREALVISCGDGSRVMAGVAGSTVPAGMKPGEVYIMSKAASVYLMNDGTVKVNGNIILTGNADVTGVVNITGALIVNGVVK